MDTIQLLTDHIYLTLTLFGVVLIFWYMPNDERSKELTGDFDKSWGVLSRQNTGLSLGGINRKISKKMSYMGSLCVAPSGAGKTTISLISSVLQAMCSMIILDPTGQIRKETSGCKQAQGFKIKVVRFDQLMGLGFNLLKRARTVTEKYKLALALFGKDGDKDFWNNSGQMLLVLIFKIQELLPSKFQTISHSIQILGIMQSDGKKLDRFVAKNADATLYSEYRSVIAQEQKVLANTISTVQAKLRCFNDPIIAAATATDQIDIEELRRDKVIIYVQCGLSKFYQPILSVFFTQIFDLLLNRIPEKDENDIALIIEEGGSIFIPGLTEFLVNCRKNRIQLLLAIQSLFQLRSTYGNDNAQVIVDNMANIMAYGRIGEDLAMMISKRLGRWEFEDEKGRKVTKNVKEIDELMHMEDGTGILLSGAKRPILVRGLNPYYKNRKYRQMADMPEVDFKGKLSAEIPFLDLDELNRPKPEEDV